jgi:hypothetical protein
MGGVVEDLSAPTRMRPVLETGHNEELETVRV